MSEVSLLPIDNSVAESSVNVEKNSWKKWAGLCVLSLGLAIIVIDTTLLNVSLSTIIKDLNTDLQSLQWVITGYALVLAAFTITGGRLGDLFGRKRMFILGAIIFALGSFIASVSHSIPVLLAGEAIIEGIGAALMMPATASLVVANFKGKDRATAFGIWGAVAGASSAIGPLLGGYLTSHYSWRWGFRINVFIAAIVVIGSMLLLKESLDERKPGLDWWGVILSSLGLLSITFGIIESSSLGWWTAKKTFEIFGHQVSFGNISLVPIAIAFGLLLMALFFWWENYTEKRGNSPLVSLKLMQNEQFMSGALTTAILTLGMAGMVFALPVFLQTVNNLDAFNTGLALLPMSIALLIFAPLSGVLSKKITPKYLIQAGLLIDVVAAFILRATIKVDMPVSHLIPGLALYGMGMGMVMAPISNLVLSAVPVEMSGEASGVNNTLRQVGATLGAAIIGAAVLTSLSTHLVNGIQNSPIVSNVAKQQIIQGVTDSGSNIQFGLYHALPKTTPVLEAQEMQALVKESSARATQDAYVYSAFFAFLCFIASLFLPKTNINDTEASKIKETHGRRKIVIAIVLLVIDIAMLVFLLKQSANKAVATGLMPNAEQIRADFRPDAPIVIPPVNTDVSTSSTSTIVYFSSPRGGIINTTTPNAESVQILEPTIYSNVNLGFSMVISNLWQATESNDGHTIIFTNAKGENISVQVYSAPSEGLSLVESQLSGSDSVRNLTKSTFQGDPALEFRTTTGLQAVAVIHGNKLYYIMGSTISGEPISTFKFQ